MLLKTDELNVLNITKKKLMTLANGAECLSTKFLDNWVTNNNNNYRKLKSSRIPRSCQTMLDHPPIVNMSSYWTSEDTVLLENWMAEKPEEPTQNSIENKNLTDELTCQIEEPYFNSLDENILCQNNMENSHIMQPIIKMEGDILEIEYFIDEISDDDGDVIKNKDEAANYLQHDKNNNNDDCKRLYVPDDNSTTETYAQKFCSTTPTRINHDLMHNTPKISKHKVADNRGLSPRRCQKYKEFLVKKDGENNLSCLNKNDNEKCTTDDNDNYQQNEKKCNAKSSKSTDFEFDEHRPLSQNVPESYNEQKNNLLKKEESIMYERGGSARIRTRSNEIKSEIKSFLSFRCPNKKNKSDKKIKKKYVISEEGAAGPIWPAVLLTYDRGVSPGIPENDSEEKQI